MIELHAALAIDAKNKIGECPVWDARHQRLLWVDHAAGIIHEARSTETGGWQESQRWELDRPVAAALPRRAGGLIIASGIEILFFDEATGNTTHFASLDADPTLIRWNEGKCDALGRLWLGTIATDFSRRAALYRVDSSGAIRPMLENVTLSNGLDWSPDGTVLYYIDSLASTIEAFDIDDRTGVLSNRRILVRFHRGEGGANGMAVDHDGHLWVAVTGGGEVRHYSPAGQLQGRIKIATTGATSCAFGALDGEELFITSRSGRVNEEIARQLGLTHRMMEDNSPSAGGVFTCRPGPSGAPATPFNG